MQAVRKGLSGQRDSTGSQLAFGVFLVRRAQSQPAPSPICPFSFSILCLFLTKAGQHRRRLLASPANISQPHPKAQTSTLGKPGPCFAMLPATRPRQTREGSRHRLCIFPEQDLAQYFGVTQTGYT